MEQKAQQALADTCRRPNTWTPIVDTKSCEQKQDENVIVLRLNRSYLPAHQTSMENYYHVPALSSAEFSGDP